MLLNLVSLVSLVTGLTSATTYWVAVQTSSLTHSGTDSEIHIKIRGEKGVVSSRIDNSGHDDFQAGHTDNFELGLGDVGRITGVEMVTHGGDAFLFNWVSARSSVDTDTTYFYNVNRLWLSRDTNEGVAMVTLQSQGDKTYIVSPRTGTVTHAGSSNVGLSMVLEGSSGKRAYTSYLDPKEGSFEEGVLDNFELRNMPDLGSVTCVTLEAAESDAWYFDVIAVEEDGGSAVLFPNTYRKFLSSDSSEGMTSMRLCA